MDLSRAEIEAYQRRLREDETPEPEPLDVNDLRDIWERGNARRPLPPNHSINHKADLVRIERKWKTFCSTLKVADWKKAIQTMTFENRGLAEAFLRYLIRISKQRKGRQITAQSSIRVYSRKLHGLIKKYTGQDPEPELVAHLYKVVVTEITPTYGLRREPKMKPTMGPDLFIYHMHFLWAKDIARFHIGLDRIDDIAIRQICMWTGCRKHELVYNKPSNQEAIVKEYDDESDAYTDVDINIKEPGQVRRCWVCDDIEERNDPRLQVLCWEDIDLWILQDPEHSGGRDKLAMQVLFRFHKGHNNKIEPTWFLFVEEERPGLCPVSHVLAKALAEKVVATSGYQTNAEPYFNTNISRKAVKIRWKSEWRHKPVFRRTLNALGEKSDEPLTAATFDSHSDRLGIAMGLSEKLSQYSYRRGFAETIDKNYRQSVRDQSLRHRPNSTTYQSYYHNARMNAVVQDAFLGRQTDSPYLALLNHMGLRMDENAPTSICDDVMRMMGSNRAIHRLENESGRLKVELTEKFGRPSRATPKEKARYAEIKSDLRTARQKHRRKAFKIIRKGHFDKKDEEELQNQLQGIPATAPVEQQVQLLPERQRIASILCDNTEDLTDKEIVSRKIEAINSMVAYAFVAEPLIRASKNKLKTTTAAKKTVLPRQLGRPIAPRPISTNASNTDPQLPTPPPPYIRIDPRRGLECTLTLTRKAPESCIWCKKTYTRRAMLWNHLEDHLSLANGGAVECPACSEVFINPTAFKAHADQAHGKSFRPDKSFDEMV